VAWTRSAAGTPSAVCVAALVLGGAALPATIDAQEAAAEGRPEMMREPTSYVDVIDAFDDEDLFDLNISVGYLRTWEFGTIQRQADGPAVGDGRNSTHWNDIANYERGINTLNIGLDVGIFRDLAVYARLPLILSDDRSLASADGFQASYLDTGLDGPLFDLSDPFRSPTRSGVDYLGVGLAWSILNQNRDETLPTWMVMIEGRFNLGDPMRACQAVTGANPNCNYRSGTMPPMPVPATPSAGVGRGMNALRVETRSSWRYEAVEPYAGLAFQIEWPGYSNGAFLPQGDLQGYINELPPIFGRFTLGMAIIPWEDREHFQRFSIDIRLNGDYLSEGHDYSPLYDALGSSPNLQLATATADCADCGPGSIHFYGLTDTQSHGRLGGSLTLEMVAARYIRFSLLAGFLYSPSYVITQADACNPNVSNIPDRDPRIGTCVSGIINPHHRPAIDLPGVRFRMEEQWQVDLGVNVSATF
jgi:hypothetical protein